jgi:hypothetical protein
MNIYLKAKLYELMELWINENCETDDWPDIYIGGKTSEFMAEAAASVFDSIEEFQTYCVKEGFLEKS